MTNKTLIDQVRESYSMFEERCLATRMAKALLAVDEVLKNFEEHKQMRIWDLATEIAKAIEESNV